jgi:hypothetical protein
MILEKLNIGQLDNVTFNFTSLNRSGGRKNKFHTFVGSDKVMGEDFGRAPRRFKINFYIHGVLDDYFNSKDEIVAVLEKEGLTRIVHPTDKIITAMPDGLYTINETITELGKATISQVYIEVDNQVSSGFSTDIKTKSFTEDGSAVATSTGIDPTFESNVNSTDSFVAKLSVGGNVATGAKVEPSFFDKISSFQKDYKNSIYYKAFKLANKGLAIYEDTQRAGYLKSSASILDNIDAVQEIWQGSSALMQGSEKYSEFVGLVDDLNFINTGKSLVNGLSTVGEGLGGIFAFFEGNNSDAEARFVAFDQFSSYGDDVVANSTNQQTSLENIETYNNNVANRDYMQLLGLVYQTNAFVDIDFKTESELLNTELNIQNQLTKQISKYSDNQSMYRDLQGLKILVNAQANNLRIGLLKLIEVEVVNSSLMDITYSYYGNLNNYEIIKTLNNFYNPSNITGTVKVLSNG